MKVKQFIMVLGAVVALIATTMACYAVNPTLSPGVYSLVTKMKKVGVEKEYSDMSEYRLVMDGTNLVLTPVKFPEPDLAGIVQGTRVFLATRYRDPMLVGLKVRVVLEGEINREDSASGIAKGFSFTNNYLNGTWTLQRTKAE